MQHLTTSQLLGVLKRRGVALPDEVQPREHYVELCAAHGVTEVAADELGLPAAREAAAPAAAASPPRSPQRPAAPREAWASSPSADAAPAPPRARRGVVDPVACAGSP